MTVEINAPTRASSGDVLDPRANNAKEQIIGSQLMDWVLRGWVFSVGLLSDDATNIASVTTLADTTPTLSLQSPSGGDTIVIPLRVTVDVVDASGGLATIDLAYTKSARECATIMTLSGTALTGIVNRLTTNPQTTAKATVLRTVTASALLVTDSIVIAHKELPAAFLTAATFANPSFDYVFSEPLGLVEGAALLVYAYSAGTAGEVRPSITWAEIPSSVYKP